MGGWCWEGWQTRTGDSGGVLDVGKKVEKVKPGWRRQATAYVSRPCDFPDRAHGPCSLGATTATTSKTMRATASATIVYCKEVVCLGTLWPAWTTKPNCRRQRKTTSSKRPQTCKQRTSLSRYPSVGRLSLHNLDVVVAEDVCSGDIVDALLSQPSSHDLFLVAGFPPSTFFFSCCASAPHVARHAPLLEHRPRRTQDWIHCSR
ncbi:uncharacterized protein SCHCODRAFT_02271188 [Schizophyllum commune H4-8]|uniref:uncharacterized protein n=1 Tax=Schizophyllum commune (strain H4-8 / FGSC 9210) TaxID=578458 RepID=UPI00215EC001|nr:uncharacterized protein SCHCODRAFT_02271188 [Schizophyllum commune H4-8]KAI5894190.1 hypothetical protein SCHCODRAFT_02271188 [Schizophyllum commune H4-8]